MRLTCTTIVPSTRSDSVCPRSPRPRHVLVASWRFVARARENFSAGPRWKGACLALTAPGYGRAEVPCHCCQAVGRSRGRAKVVPLACSWGCVTR